MAIPDQNAVEDVLAQCYDQKDSGSSKFPGMSYEDGVIAALEWMSPEHDDINPMDD